MSDASLPSSKARAEVLAKVQRMQSSYDLAVEREQEAEAICSKVAKKVDAVSEQLRAARRNKQPTVTLEQELANLRHELKVEREELSELQERRKDARSELHGAEQERDRYVEDVELVGAPARFETAIRAANGVLTALAVAALTTSFQVNQHKDLLAVAIIASGAALGLGLLSYAPSVLAASLDALRRKSASGGAMSYLVSWHGWIRRMQIVVLVVLVVLIVVAWVFVAKAFFAAPE